MSRTSNERALNKIVRDLNEITNSERELNYLSSLHEDKINFLIEFLVIGNLSLCYTDNRYAQDFYTDEFNKILSSLVTRTKELLNFEIIKEEPDDTNYDNRIVLFSLMGSNYVCAVIRDSDDTSYIERASIEEVKLTRVEVVSYEPL